MPATIIASPFPSTNRDGVFVDIQQADQSPPQLVSDMLGVIGETSKGQPNVGVRVGSITDFTDTYGPETINPVTGRPLSGYVATRAIKAQRAYDEWFVRVMNAYGATAYVTLKTAAAASIMAIRASSPGTWARGFSVTSAPNAGNAALTDVTTTDSLSGKSETVYGVDFTNNAGAIAAINRAATLVQTSQPVLDAPTAAPTATVGAGGTLPAGTYYAGLAKHAAGGGLTSMGPESGPITVAANGTVTLTTPADANADLIYGYLTPANGAPGSEVFAGQAAPGSSLVIAAAPAAGAATPAVVNTATYGPGAAAAPAAGTVPFVTASAPGAGAGNDGAGCTAAQYLGAASPLSGANAFAALDVKPNAVLLAEDAGADTTQWQAQADLAFTNGWQAWLCLPRGTSYAAVAGLMTAAAVQSVKASPTGGSLSVEYPEYTLYDAVLGATTTLMPTSLAAGVVAVQDANGSGANRPISIGFGASPRPADRVGPAIDLTDAQVQALIALGVNPHTRHIQAGGIGREKDLTLGPGPCGTARGAHLRMVNLTARALGDISGPFVEQLDTPDLRTRVESAVLGLLQRWANDGLIPGNASGAPQTAAPAATPTATGGKRANPATTPQTTTSALATSSTTTYYSAACDSTSNGPGAPAGLLRCRVAVSYYGVAEQIVFDLYPTIAKVAIASAQTVTS